MIFPILDGVYDILQGQQTQVGYDGNRIFEKQFYSLEKKESEYNYKRGPYLSYLISTIDDISLLLVRNNVFFNFVGSMPISVPLYGTNILNANSYG